jgi:hypothetical protein
MLEWLVAAVMLTFARQPNAPHRDDVSRMLPVCAAKAWAAG